jgi:regulator of protease activity HflC (stomatin/prohibitin superfamily)
MSKYIINEDSRGLLIKNGILDRILSPGKEEISDGAISGNVFKVEIVPIKSSIPVQYVDAILSSKKDLLNHFIIHECEESESKILLRDKQVLSFVAPNNRVVYFKEVGEIKAISYDLSKDCRVDKSIQSLVQKSLRSSEHLEHLNIDKYTRTLVFMYNKIVEILDPGQYSYIKSLKNLEFINVSNTYSPMTFDSYLDIELLVYEIKHNPKFKDEIKIFETDGHTVKIISVNDKYSTILKPRQYALYFEDIGKITSIDYDTNETLEIPKDVYNNIVYAGTNNPFIDEIVVASNTKLLLFIDNQLARVLEPGKYHYLNIFNNLIKHVYSSALNTIEVGGQEIMTNDKVMIRINLTADYSITDPEAVFNIYGPDCKPFIYKELQLRLREAIGTKTLNQTLEEKESINEILAKPIKDGIEGNAIHLTNIFIKDVILPGEIRTIMNQVVEAEKKAQANVIKRREETAATRSLLNTAKLIQDNPTLMRLKELETIEKVVENVKELKIYGGLDGVMKNLINIDGV